MPSIEKLYNYKVLCLTEAYNFGIEFIFIWDELRKLVHEKYIYYTHPHDTTSREKNADI